MIRNDMILAGMQALRDAAPSGSRGVMPSDTGRPVTRKYDVKALGDNESSSEEVQPSRDPSDGSAPRVHHEEIKAMTLETPAPPPACVPADVAGIVADPFNNPFQIGDTFTLSPFQATGTAPLTYLWSTGETTETISVTVTDAMITGKDGTGLGTINFGLTVFNACNETGKNTSGGFAAQGLP